MLYKLPSLFILLSLLFSFSLNAQVKYNKENGPYEFKHIKDIGVGPVKDQTRSSTCWSFSALSFMESELLRMGKPIVDLSEMFIVRHTYIDKAKKFVRMHGELNFGPGGAFHDVTNMIRKYGIVPYDVYPEIKEEGQGLNHGELDAIMHEMVKAVIKNKNKKLSSKWEEAINAVLDVYLGGVPSEFSVDGKKYTPLSYAKSLGINTDDYITLTSYTHHPFYEKFILEVPDNWSWDEAYNVPLKDLEKTIDHALTNGFSIAWASDVSEKGFSFKNGVAVVPEVDWVDMSKEERDSLFASIVKEKEITQEMRQEAFDNYTTTDDHGMQITGYATAQNGMKFYIVKNSWGDDSNDCGGYFYASKPFVLYKTMDIMVHKDAIPPSVLNNLKL